MTELIDDATLAKLEALEKAATPGPWRVVNPNWAVGSLDMGLAAPGDANVLAECFAEFHTRGTVCPNEARANADLIAQARNALPDLLATIRELKARVAEQEQLHDISPDERVVLMPRGYHDVEEFYKEAPVPIPETRNAQIAIVKHWMWHEIPLIGAEGDSHWTDPRGFVLPLPDFVGTLVGVAELMRELNEKASKVEQYWWWSQNARRLVDAPRDALICVRHGLAARTLFLVPWFWSPPDHPGDCVGDAWLSVFGQLAQANKEIIRLKARVAELEQLKEAPDASISQSG